MGHPFFVSQNLLLLFPKNIYQRVTLYARNISKTRE